VATTKNDQWSFYALPRVFLRIICALIVHIGVDFVRLVRRVAVGNRRGSSNVKAMKKIRLLSVDAMKAIYEREMTRKGLPADCDEMKLAEIVRNLEKAIPPGVEIEYIIGDEIRAETADPESKDDPE
jgi:hypothetical protein